MPAYAQLADLLKAQIAQGRLQPGDPVPSLRALMEQYGLSSNTVLRALTQLAREGAVTSRRGSRTRVAQRRPKGTEILLCFPDDWPRQKYQMDFLGSLVAGVRAASDGHNRRILVTHAANGLPTGDELVHTARLRNADGIIAYRPSPEILPALEAASRALPVASVFREVPGGCADCIVPTMDPLRALLLRRVDEGRRAFAFVLGWEAYLSPEQGANDPYVLFWRAFQDTLASAGIKPLIEVCRDGERTPERFGQVRESVRDAEVLAFVGIEAADLGREESRAEWIFYTEAPGAVELMRGKTTILYLGIESVGRAAADALASRVAAGGAGPARRIELAPKLIAQS